MKIVKSHLNNYSSTEYSISLDHIQSQYISMCLIFGNANFCYGNFTAFIIEENNNVSQVSNAPTSLVGSSSIYYKNGVYIFGGWSSMATIHASKYSLKNGTWKNLNIMPAFSSFVSFAEKKIWLSGREHSKTYCYDIIQNNYTELQSVKANYTKILCGNRKNYYVIEACGNIYESDYESDFEWMMWKELGSSEIENTPLIGCKVRWQGKVYFAFSNYNLYEFDLREKKIQKIKTI
ncbi:unnamed protein product [Blepharisma stoltei]|uniref:Uncharacterized protein n=1 Tax=Blepharisma stoltei TaxID=1481888 RepID=A0AAU9JTM9_9CILI|nr:unnamed protein product [Blepharisma stoltei]